MSELSVNVKHLDLLTLTWLPRVGETWKPSSMDIGLQEVSVLTRGIPKRVFEKNMVVCTLIRSLLWHITATTAALMWFDSFYYIVYIWPFAGR